MYHGIGHFAAVVAVGGGIRRRGCVGGSCGRNVGQHPVSSLLFTQLLDWVKDANGFLWGLQFLDPPALRHGALLYPSLGLRSGSRSSARRRKLFGNFDLRGGCRQVGNELFQALATAIAAQVGTGAVGAMTR